LLDFEIQGYFQFQILKVLIIKMKRYNFSFHQLMIIPLIIFCFALGRTGLAEEKNDYVSSTFFILLHIPNSCAFIGISHTLDLTVYQRWKSGGNP